MDYTEQAAQAQRTAEQIATIGFAAIAVAIVALIIWAVIRSTRRSVAPLNSLGAQRAQERYEQREALRRIVVR